MLSVENRTNIHREGIFTNYFNVINLTELDECDPLQQLYGDIKLYFIII